MREHIAEQNLVFDQSEVPAISEIDWKDYEQTCAKACERERCGARCQFDEIECSEALASHVVNEVLKGSGVMHGKRVVE